MISTRNDVTFRDMLTGGRFYYGAELVSTRGIPAPGAPSQLLDLARALLADPRIGWISITDNPGGGPMLPPDWLAGQVAEHRAQVVVHLTCKDMNRNGLEAAAWRYAAEGFENVLALTGDYPTGGFGGIADPVFDLDSLGLISLLRSMNEGLRIPGRRGAVETLPATNFFIGCCASPFKRYERELMPQYFKLLRKIQAGAQWVIPQLGFAAGYLGGINKAEAFGEIIDLAESYGENDWQEFLKEIRFSQPDEFFLFEHDPATGTSDPTRINPEYLRSLRKPPKSKQVTLGYRISRRVHDWAFSRGKGLYGLMEKIFARWDRKPGLMSRLSYWLEKEAKHMGYGCNDCGDCSLPDCAYLCPLAQCSKHSRNGPCGGSASGQCELLDKECFWARVYERLKHYGESERMFDRPIVLYNPKLKHTSAWANTYLARDHFAATKEEPSTGDKSS